MAVLTSSSTLVRPIASVRVAGFVAIALGAFFVWGAGLANSAAIHDTAHDTRHGYGFPCH
jgi:cobalt transporter subunit CbtB